MKKTTFDERFEKAVNAFFEDENKFEISQLAVLENSSVLATDLTAENNKLATEKIDSIVNILKKVFAFFPGTQILYFFGAFSTFISIVFPQDFIHLFNPWGLFWIISGTFLTWVGLGDLRNKKHLFLPASSLATGTILGLVFGTLSKFFPDIYKLVFGGFPIFFLFFPLAFIVPILVKSWLDKEENK